MRPADVRDLLTGAQALARALRALDVEVAFGPPGVHHLAAWECLPDSGVRLVGMLYEQTAGYAADGYARATGRLGVALTTGPGAANIVAATGEAWAGHSPLLVLATDIPTTDQASLLRPVTKDVVRVERAAELYDQVVLAGRRALCAPRRPVYVELPTDLLSAEVDEPVELLTAVPAVFVRYLDDAVAPEIAAARRPLIWAGGGATSASAGPALAELAQRLGAPVLTSYGGRGLLPPEHPCLVPLPPQAPEVGALWDAADLVLVLGGDFGAMHTQGLRLPRPPRLVTVDLGEPVDEPPDHWVRGDVAAVLAELAKQLVQIEPRAPWFDRPAGRSSYRGPRGGIEFLDAFEAGLPADAVVVADRCVAGSWYAGFGRVERPRGLACPVGWDAPGFGFPAALGSSLSGRATVALVGDGGFLAACGDLPTAARERLPVTVVVVEDGEYGLLPHDPPDFVALAGAFGVPARQVGLADLAAAVSGGIASRSPNLVRLVACGRLGQTRSQPA